MTGGDAAQGAYPALCAVLCSILANMLWRFGPFLIAAGLVCAHTQADVLERIRHPVMDTARFEQFERSLRLDEESRVSFQLACVQYSSDRTGIATAWRVFNDLLRPSYPWANGDPDLQMRLKAAEQMRLHTLHQEAMARDDAFISELVEIAPSHKQAIQDVARCCRRLAFAKEGDVTSLQVAGADADIVQAAIDVHLLEMLDVQGRSIFDDYAQRLDRLLRDYEAVDLEYALTSPRLFDDLVRLQGHSDVEERTMALEAWSSLEAKRASMISQIRLHHVAFVESSRSALAGAAHLDEWYTRVATQLYPFIWSGNEPERLREAALALGSLDIRQRDAIEEIMKLYRAEREARRARMEPLYARTISLDAWRNKFALRASAVCNVPVSDEFAAIRAEFDESCKKWQKRVEHVIKSIHDVMTPDQRAEIQGIP